jgi:hypothetical protein
MWPISPHWYLSQRVSLELWFEKVEHTYLVAFGGLAAAAATTGAAHRALTRDVSGLAALVAGLVILCRFRAITAWKS